MSRLLPALFAFFIMVLPLQAQVPGQDGTLTPETPAPPVMPMTIDRLAGILHALDPEAAPRAGGLGLTLGGVPVVVYADPRANRMRAVVPVASARGLSPDDMERILQANFDTALDARYAIAQGRLWSVYIHPLTELQPQQLISGLVQTVTLAQTYGGAYASGSLSFGRGDSAERYRELMRQLAPRGEAL